MADNKVTPVHSVHAEEDILGQLMVEPRDQAMIFESVREEDFFITRHRIIFAVAKKLFMNSTTVDLHSVTVELEHQDMFDQIGGVDTLPDLMNSYREDVRYQIRILKDSSRLREFQRLFMNHIGQANKPGVETEKLLKAAENDLYKLLVGEESDNTRHIKDVMVRTVKHLESIQGSDSGVTGIASGLDYDQITAGWQKKELYVIAGRPGMGKTAFVLQNLKAAARSGINVGVLTMEMGNESLVTRLLLAEAGIDSWKARSGRMNETEKIAMYEKAALLSELGILMDDTTDMDPSKLRIKARMLKQQYDIGLLAVDYLQLMKGDDESRERQVADISRTCKLLSKELDIPVLGVSQLSRKPDDRRGWGTRPQLGDLRESGALEQDADAVIFLYRPEEYGLESYPDGESTENITEVIVDKHRNGPTGTKKLLFQKEFMQFQNLKRELVPKGPPVSHWTDDEAVV